MSTFITILIGIMIVSPILVSVFFLIFKKWTGRTITMKTRADYITPFLFASVYIIARALFGDGVGYTLLIIAIVIGLLYAIYEKRRVKDFEISRLFRKIWRLYFILLFIAYVLLMTMGLVLAIIHAVSK